MRLIIFITLFCITAQVFGQVAINSTGGSADASAVLDVSSNSKGFIPPRMTAAQRIAINSPAEGLMVFDLDSLELFYYNGSSWRAINQAVSASKGIGEKYLGGVVAYVYYDSLGTEHGFVVAPTDLDPGNDDQWQTSGSTTNARNLYDGKLNTATIGTTNNSWMAQVDTANGWYIPSILEFRLLYMNLYDVNKSLEQNGYTPLNIWHPYWTSTEYSSSRAWYIERDEFQVKNGSKTNYKHFRAIKSF